MTSEEASPGPCSSDPALGSSAHGVAIVRLCHDLAQAASLEAMFERVVDALVSVVRVDRAAVLTLDDDGVMRFRATRGLSAPYRARAEGHSPWSSESAQVAPVLVDDVAADADLAPMRPVLAAEGLAAVAFLPLIGGGRLLGKFVLYAGEPTVWRERDLDFAYAAADLLASFLLREAIQARLLQARKMESLGFLAGGIAHDFNNLLTSIFGYVELRRAEVSSTGGAYLDELRATANRAAELTRQLLGFARQQPGGDEWLDLAVFVGELRTLLQQLCSDCCRVEFELPVGLGLVHASRSQLLQVVLNLVANARDAMPDGGVVRIAVQAGAAAGEVRLVVSDTGVGMSERVRQRIFEPLFTTKGPGEGTGLGLPTCLAIVSSIGGDIAVQSSPGRGSRFVVALPCKGTPEPGPASEKTSSPKTPSPKAPVRGNTTVLLVDDQPALARVLAKSLTGMGYEVVTAEDGAAALKVLAEREVDVVVSDVVMPRMGGAELAAEMKRSRPGTPLLFMTGFVETPYELPAEVPLLRKPFAPQQLGNQIAQLLHR